MHYLNTLSSYRWISIGLCAFILLVAGAGSLGIIWMRTQISASAVNAAQLERQARAIENDNATLSARVARAHNPEFLISHMPEGLRPTESSQIIWIQADARPAYLASTPPAPLPASEQSAATVENPATVSFDLALVNQPRGPKP